MKSLHFLLIAISLALLTPLHADAGPKLYGGEGGTLNFVTGNKVLFSLSPSIADEGWAFSSATAALQRTVALNAPFPLDLETDGKHLAGDFSAVEKNGVVDAMWNFTAKDAVEFQSLIVAADFPLQQLVGCRWTAGTASGTFPARFTVPGIYMGEVASLDLAFPDQHEVEFTFPKPTFIVLQDNRQWGAPTFTLRIGRGHGKMAPGESFAVTTSVTTPERLGYDPGKPAFMQPVTLQAGDTWVPLKEDTLDILPGSALDLSGLGFTDGPCGAKGRIIVSGDGHFVCANEPDKRRRFYGVNFCFDANYLTKDEVDRVLDRLVRLGYNAIRIHHYEGLLTGWKPGFDWDPAKVDQLDYLMAGCAKRGIWITTDLFVSRSVSGEQIGLPQYNAPPENRVPMNTYKLLVQVSDSAFKDWTIFARKFLDRVNPYTGKRVADDPALAWISLVNEGPVTNDWSVARRMPEWQAAWNKWLGARYPTRDALAAAIGDLGANEDPQKNTVAMPDYPDAKTPRAVLGSLFAAATEKVTFERMRDFLRNEIKCPALLTNMNNSGPQVIPLIGTRAEYDYVDEHFYVDHPRFLQKPWQLPSYCSNNNPVAAGAPGASSVATTRIFGKPFTITEFNYAGPSRYRGVGGVLTGAMAALQDWDALWRFDYSSSEKSMFTPDRATYFDEVSDPLNQAADRLSVLLFLRGDVSRASNGLAMVATPDSLEKPTPAMNLSPLQDLAWRTAVGGMVTDDATQPSSKEISIPINSGSDDTAITAALAKASIPPTAPGDPIHSETSQITLAPKDSVLAVDTPKSAGGFADVGKSIDAPKAGVHIDGVTTEATVFVNSLDDAPISSSKRLLVTHLTDLQNTGARFGEGARQTLESWGAVPHLVRDGSATIHLTLDEPSAYTVWSLAPSGQRLGKVDAKVNGTQLTFTAQVRSPEGAQMLYEIAR